MIYFLCGNNFTEKKKKLDTLLDFLFTKKPNASFFKLDSSSFEEGQLDELAKGQTLFEKKYVVLLDHLLDSPARDYILNNLKALETSDNIFILLEDNVDAKTKERISKKAKKTQNFFTKEKIAKKPFNIFDVADAFGTRDKKKVWVAYQKALYNNIEPEEIQSILLWQVRSMYLAKTESSAGSAKLKPFVFKKSLSFSKKFSEEDLQKISSELVSLYHECRRGNNELNTGLEQILLET